MKDRPDLNAGGFPKSEGHYADTARTDNRSVKQIFQDIVDHVSDIIRSEIQLAKTEVRQDVIHYMKAGALLGIAAVLVLYAVGFVLLGIVYGLQPLMPGWQPFSLAWR